MSTRLVILGLLREKPLHGYEIKRLIQQRMGDWTSIAFGSIYFGLGKLAEQGLIRKAATEQEGNRPSRSVYEITRAGREEFIRLLREVWTESERIFYTFDLGIYFMKALPPDEVKEHLARRAAGLEQVLDLLHREKIEKTARAEVPDHARAIFDHTLIHLEAERDWLVEVMARVDSGEY